MPIPPASPPSLSPHHPALQSLPPADRTAFCRHSAGPSMRPKHATILAAIENSCATFPNSPAAIALTADGQLDNHSRITYARLNHRANQLATHLHQLGVRPGHAVCLFAVRHVDFLVAILAVLKTGAHYVPQHVGVAPATQLARIARVCQSSVVLTFSTLRAQLPPFDPHVSVVCVDDVPTRGPDRPDIPATFAAVRQVRPSDPAYTVFTSGTTGTPKGVQVTHRNLANIMLTQPMSLGLRPGVRIAQTLSIAFDMAAWEMLACLAHGAELLIRHRDIAAAVRHAHVVISTPSVLARVDACASPLVRTVVVAGEPCPRALADCWSARCEFFNACGPTEVTIVNTAGRLAPGDEVSIGVPTPNNRVYVLADDGRPCRMGEVGEMWAAGACVSNGYVGDAVQTARRFVDDPFVPGRMFRTGDLAFWNARGQLVHMGRCDDQVKVRGFRVELDGIAAVIGRMAGVRCAVVQKVGEELVAWVTPGVESTAVKEAVGKRLPYYCVPAVVVGVDDLPMTVNGKVDKRRLVDELLRASSRDDDGKAVVDTTAAGRGPSGIRAVLAVVARVYVFGGWLLLRRWLRSFGGGN